MSQRDHNRGQGDGARRRYSPPSGAGFLDHLSDQIAGTHFVKKAEQSRRDYDSGYKKGRRDRNS